MERPASVPGETKRYNYSSAYGVKSMRRILLCCLAVLLAAGCLKTAYQFPAEAGPTDGKSPDSKGGSCTPVPPGTCNDNSFAAVDSDLTADMCMGCHGASGGFTLPGGVMGDCTAFMPVSNAFFGASSLSGHQGVSPDQISKLMTDYSAWMAGVTCSSQPDAMKVPIDMSIDSPSIDS